MDDTFFAYLQRLEFMAFFSGFPLVYALITVIAGKKLSNNSFRDRLIPLLPFSYALVGTLFLGLQLRNLYPDFHFDDMFKSQQQPWLLLWGLLSVLFWIPLFSKKPIYSLLHSLVFFFFLLKDLVQQFFTTKTDRNMIRNDMKIYTDSLLLNLGALAILVLFSFLYFYFKKREKQ